MTVFLSCNIASYQILSLSSNFCIYAVCMSDRAHTASSTNILVIHCFCSSPILINSRCQVIDHSHGGADSQLGDFEFASGECRTNLRLYPCLFFHLCYRQQQQSFSSSPVRRALRRQHPHPSFSCPFLYRRQRHSSSWAP